ncbi:MAG TPA: ribose-phosphate diphosphokinase [Sphingomicrobium sp.]|jgi:ribose-phosphate pyrophosphokinase|nr:ribose-phosphate diphosphokinase [Sphingomicrobium sp.]
MNSEPALLFALETTRDLGGQVAAQLGQPLGRHEEREFGGGEQKVRPLEEVAGRDVYVINSLHGDERLSANDKLVRLLFFIGALKDAGAGCVTAVTPFIAYGRKDRRTKPRDPVNSRYIAALFEAVGTDRVVTLEVHNVSAFENSFRTCRTEHVPVAGIIANHLAAKLPSDDLAVVSPDAGGVKRAELLRHVLEEKLGRPVGKALMDKHRSMGVVSGSIFAGDVEGKTAIIFDDLISSGTTILRAAAACRAAGASRVIAAAAHGMFEADAPLFGPDGPDELIVTDTVPIPTAVADRVTMIGAAPILADVIGRLNKHEPVSDIIPYD